MESNSDNSTKQQRLHIPNYHYNEKIFCCKVGVFSVSFNEMRLATFKLFWVNMLQSKDRNAFKNRKIHGGGGRNILYLL